ncbi:hypothetical protein AMTRI_Chr05g61300 [Amborella trichopoda]
MGCLIKEFLLLSSPAALTKKLIFALVSKGKELVACSIYTPHLLQTNPPKNQIYPHSTKKKSAPFRCEMLWRALRPGYFEVVYNIAVLESLQKEMFYAIKEFFGLPQETKVKNRSEYLFWGYMAHIPQIPFFEATMLDNF